MRVDEKLSRFILENDLFTLEEDKILLGVSGGKDSMLMTLLLHRLGYRLIIAHCNFQLRGEDSDKDELLVKETAAQWGIPFFSKQFDTLAHAGANKISIQMSARELRYHWFEELRQQQQCQVIAIAQHRLDNIETVFINLLRSTGLQGLQGILPKHGKLVRPILFMDTAEIEAAVLKYKVPYRDDQSNFSTKYARNKIRLEVLPLMREIKPDFDQVMEDNILRFRESYQLLQEFVSPLRDSLFVSEDKRVVIHKDSLDPYITNIPLLYELFRPYGFEKNILDDLSRSWKNGSGSLFESKEYLLLMDREMLYIQKKKITSHKDVSIHEQTSSVSVENRTLRISVSDNKQILRERYTAQVDQDKLVYPLSIRYWQEGDRFVPLGMTGEKKLSDFFIHQKIPLFDKSQIPLLINGNGTIIWVVGYRLDNRYKITEKTKKVVTFVYV